MDEKPIVPKNENYSWLRVFANAFAGCLYAFKNERNFRVHFLVSVLVLFLSWWLSVPFWQFLFLLAAIVFGIVVEMGNTAIEKTVDLITEQYHPTAKVAKDVSAGMVLVASVGLTVIGALILLPPLWQKIINF